VGSEMLGKDGKVGRSCRGFPTLWNMFCHAAGLDSLFPTVKIFGGYVLRYWGHDTTRPVDILGGWFWMIKRQALDEVGLLDENFFFYAEDMDWCRRFHRGGWRVVFVSSAKSIHYGGGSSKNAPLRYLIQQQRADLQYWKKHHSRVGLTAYYCISTLYHFTRLSGYGFLMVISSRHNEGTAKMRRSWHCLRWLLGVPAQEIQA
jgi:GT2 family glycosyltransferase